MSFKLNDLTITARPLSIGDNDDLGDLLMKLPEDRRTNRIFRFLEFAVGGVVEGGKSPVPALNASSTAEEIEAAYQVYRKLPRSFQTQWQEELAAVEGSPKG